MKTIKITNGWNKELIKAIEWKTFEKFCVELLRASKLQALRTPLGKDDGIDIHVYKNGNFEKPEAIAQCKAWATMKVGVKNIREFYGTMKANEINKGFFFITGEFTEDAKQFAKDNKISLLDGEKIISLISKSSNLTQNYLIKFLEVNNFVYPTCPTCNKKMALRKSKKNNDRFWGCYNFPMCKQNFKISKFQSKFLNIERDD